VGCGLQDNGEFSAHDWHSLIGAVCPTESNQPTLQEHGPRILMRRNALQER